MPPPTNPPPLGIGRQDASPPATGPMGTSCRIRPAWDAGTGNGPASGCHSPPAGQSHTGGARAPPVPPGSSSQSPTRPRLAFPARTWLLLVTATTRTAVPGTGGSVPWVSLAMVAQSVSSPPQTKPEPCQHRGWATPPWEGRGAVPQARRWWDTGTPMALVAPMAPGPRRGEGVLAREGHGMAPQPRPVTAVGRPPPRL